MSPSIRKALLVALAQVLLLVSAWAKPSYTAEPSATDAHPDTDPPSKLLDGKWHSALKESVEYPGDVTLTFDFGKKTKIGVARIRPYQKGGDFEVGEMKVSVSDDKKKWTAAGSMKNAVPDWEGGEYNLPVDLYVDMDHEARYVRIEITKAPDAGRILLGEVMVGPEPEPIGQLDTKLGVWVKEYATMPGPRGEPDEKVKTVQGKVNVYEKLDYARHDPNLKGDPTHQHYRIDPVKPWWVFQMPNFEFIPADESKKEEAEEQ